MKVTWESVNDFAALLFYASVIGPCHDSSGYVQPGSDVKVTCGNLVCTHEDVSAVSTSAIDPDGVLASMSSCCVQCDLPSLVAVRCVCGPSGLVPAILEALGDLGNGERCQSKCKKSGLTQHVDGREA